MPDDACGIIITTCTSNVRAACDGDHSPSDASDSSTAYAGSTAAGSDTTADPRVGIGRWGSSSSAGGTRGTKCRVGSAPRNHGLVDASSSSSQGGTTRPFRRLSLRGGRRRGLPFLLHGLREPRCTRIQAGGLNEPPGGDIGARRGGSRARVDGTASGFGP